jgi:hypothetical protein
LISLSWAQGVKSAYLVRSTLSEAGSSVETSIEGNAYVVEASVGQSSAIGTFYVTKYAVLQGFIQPYTVSQLKALLPFSNFEATVFPNPFLDHVTISFSEQIKGNVEVEVYDMLGRTIFSKSYSANQVIEVSFNQLPVANYILKMTTNGQVYLKKIIKN